MERAHHARQFAVEDWDWWHSARQRVLARVLLAGLATGDAGLATGDAGLATGDAGLATGNSPRTGRKTLDVLDVGCGTGGTTAHLASALRARHDGVTVTGCDVAPEALQHAASRGISPLVQASAEALPFAAGSFDVVLALDVLEHHAEDQAVASEWRRVLRPGGLLLATVPAFQFLWGPHDVLSHHHRRYRLPGLVSVLAASGLRVVRATYFNTLLFPVVAAVQLVRRVLRRGRPVVAASDLPNRMPRAMNALLRGTFAAEGPWVERRAFPFGVSILALAAPAQAVAEGAAA